MGYGAFTETSLSLKFDCQRFSQVAIERVTALY